MDPKSSMKPVRKRYLKETEIPRVLEEMLDIPSGSEDEFDFEDSDDDPTYDPNTLEPQASSDSDTDSDQEPMITAPSTSRQENTNSRSNLINLNQTTQKNPVLDTIQNGGRRPINCTWKKKNLFLSEEEKKFTGNMNYPEEIENLDTPFQFVKYFLTDELLERIHSETLLYAVQKNPNNTFTPTKNDIEKYIGICILSSVTHNDNVRDFWHGVIGNEMVKNTMSINMFEKIRAILHFNDNAKEIPKGQT